MFIKDRPYNDTELKLIEAYKKQLPMLQSESRMHYKITKITDDVKAINLLNSTHLSLGSQIILLHFLFRSFDRRNLSSYSYMEHIPLAYRSILKKGAEANREFTSFALYFYAHRILSIPQNDFEQALASNVNPAELAQHGLMVDSLFYNHNAIKNHLRTAALETIHEIVSRGTSFSQPLKTHFIHYVIFRGQFVNEYPTPAHKAPSLVFTIPPTAKRQKTDVASDELVSYDWANLSPPIPFTEPVNPVAEIDDVLIGEPIPAAIENDYNYDDEIPPAPLVRASSFNQLNELVGDFSQVIGVGEELSEDEEEQYSNQAPESSSELSPAQQGSRVDNLVSFIARKYLGLLPPTALPQSIEHKPNPKLTINMPCDFIQLDSVENHSTAKTVKFPIRIAESEFTYITKCRKLPSPKKEVSFIFAGRAGGEADNKHTMIPTSFTERVLVNDWYTHRLILVMPQEQYEKIYGKQEIPDDIDILVINKLESKQFGNYDTHCISARRISALLFATHLELNHCMFCDDNIEQIILENQENGEWDTVYTTLAKVAAENNSVCSSIPSITPRNYNFKANKLGSKAFYLNLLLLKQYINMHDGENVFSLFPPSKMSQWVAEDYYWQLMMQLLIDQSGQQTKGYFEAPLEIIRLQRSIFGKHLAHNSSINAISYLECPAEEMFSELQAHEHYPLFLSVYKKIQEMVEKSIEAVRNQQQKIDASNILERHWKANNPAQALTAKPSLQARNQLSNKEILEQLAQCLADHQHKFKSYLRPHQVMALAKLSELLKTQKETNPESIFNTSILFEMTTGAGKSALIVLLAHLLYQQMFNEPIVIVVPTIDLVKQMYKEFVKWQEPLAELFPDTIMSLANVIQVSSNASHLSHETVARNIHLKNKNVVQIMCLRSFKLNEHIKPKALFIDEEHIITEPEFKDLIKSSTSSAALLCAFSATPKEQRKANTLFYKHSISVTRPELLEAGLTAPLIVHPFAIEHKEGKLIQLKYVSVDILRPLIDKLINEIPHLRHPQGFLITNKPSLFCFPRGTNLRAIQEQLKEKGLNAYVIHSSNNNYKEEIKQFEQDPKGIALVVDMLTYGYDNRKIYTVGIFQKSMSPAHVMQLANRASRLNDSDPNKLAYVLLFTELWAKVYRQYLPHMQEYGDIYAEISPEAIAQHKKQTQASRSLTSLLFTQQSTLFKPVPEINKSAQIELELESGLTI